MPTGYTAKLMEQGQSFPDFAMLCARAFGACIDLRDEPFDAPIPDTFKPSSYHVQALIDAQMLCSKLSAMSETAQREFGELQKRQVIYQSKKYVAEKKLENQRLTDMLSEIKKWTPPTPDHEGIKRFMLEQIRMSINDTSYSEDSLEANETKEPIDFYYAALESSKSSVDYHTKQLQKEIERTHGRTEWVRQLRESL